MGQLLRDAPQLMRDRIREVRRQVNELLTAERWVVMVAGRGVQLVRDRPHADGSFDIDVEPSAAGPAHIDPGMGAPRPAFWGDVRSEGQRRPP